MGTMVYKVNVWVLGWSLALEKEGRRVVDGSVGGWMSLFSFGVWRD